MYQVLRDNPDGSHSSDVDNFKTYGEAQNFKKRLERRGYQQIVIWNTDNNPLSKMLSLGTNPSRRSR